MYEIYKMYEIWLKFSCSLGHPWEVPIFENCESNASILKNRR